MSREKLERTLEAVEHLGQTAEDSFSRLSQEADQGSLSGVQFHLKAAEITEQLMQKLEQIHAREIAGKLWRDEIHEIRATFQQARDRINRASIEA